MKNKLKASLLFASAALATQAFSFDISNIQVTGADVAEGDPDANYVLAGGTALRVLGSEQPSAWFDDPRKVS